MPVKAQTVASHLSGVSQCCHLRAGCPLCALPRLAATLLHLVLGPCLGFSPQACPLSLQLGWPLREAGGERRPTQSLAFSVVWYLHPSREDHTPSREAPSIQPSSPVPAPAPSPHPFKLG